MRENNNSLIYPVPGMTDLVYLKNVIDDPDIEVGEHTYYHDPIRDPRDFAKNNIFYHYPGAGDKIKIGKYCSIACGTKIFCSIAHHDKNSMAYYPFPLYSEHWDTLTMEDLDWPHRGETTTIGNDVWLGHECIIMPGVTIGDGAAIGTRAVVTKDVPPYTVVGGVPAKFIRKRFDDETVAKLLELKWWDLPEEELCDLLPYLVHGKLEEALSKKMVNDTARMVLERLGL